MSAKRIYTTFLFVGMAGLGCGVGAAQTDVAASLYGAFSGTTSGNNTTESPSNAAGAMIELRHISNPIVGFEGTYSFNRANEVYRYTIPPGCPTSGCALPAAVSANAHEVTGDWVASVKIANLRPFGLAGVGLLFNEPTGGEAETQSQTKPTFVYGAGLDWGVLPHIGLRFQYRGNLYRVPNLTRLYTSVDAFTHTSEPMIGAYFRF
ncbi:MAG: outer membrane beta-barrel protein [Terracidiphilus sp.]|jgi:opacity protein-like surface antigen